MMSEVISEAERDAMFKELLDAYGGDIETLHKVLGRLQNDELDDYCENRYKPKTINEGNEP